MSRGGLSGPAAWLLSRLLPEAVADAIAGDLEERLREEILPARGRVRAELWVWRQILCLRLIALWRAAHGGGAPRVVRGLLGDLRHAARSLRRDPGFATVVMVTLGVAIGSTTLAFTVVDGVLLRPLPWAEQERLVQVHTTNAALRGADSENLRVLAERMPVSYPQLRDWAARSDVFAAVGGVRAAQVTVEIDGEAERLNAPGVTAGVFDALGVPPALGRSFGAEEDVRGGARAVVLSHGFWQRRFGGAASVLGRELRVHGEPHTIVGVMPEGFWFPWPEAELWTTLPDRERNESRLAQGFLVVARLRDGWTLERAQAELDAQAERLAGEYADQVGFGARVASLRDEVVGGVERTLFVLFGAVGLVLLVACTNVANLMLVRATVRSREFALRSALGAGRARLLRAGFTEGLVLAAAGGVLGVGLAAALLRPLLSFIPDSMPRLHEIGLDPRVAAFGVALSLVAAAGIGVLPGWRAAATAPDCALREGGRTATRSRRAGRLQSALVVVQVAVACVLVISGVLLATSYGRLLNADRGFDPDGIALWMLTLPASREGGPTTGLFEAVAERVAGLPGVAGAAWATEAPFSGVLQTTSVTVPDPASGEAVSIAVDYASVDTGYFALMDVPVLAGRTFEPSDRSGDPVIVNRAFAERLWPGGSALGRTVVTGEPGTPRTIIGIVADVAADAARPPGPRLYAPIGPGRQRILALRTTLPPASLAPALRSILRELDPAIAPRDPVFVTAALRESVAAERFRAFLIGALAGIAAFLALLGVYGLMAYRVASRLPEIGVRLALGAGTVHVVRGVVAAGARLALVGTAAGLVAALAATRVIAAFLFGIAATDPATYLATGLALPAVAIVACWLPARRAARVDPLSVLTLD